MLFWKQKPDRARCASHFLGVMLAKVQGGWGAEQGEFSDCDDGHGHHSQRRNKQTDSGTQKRKNAALTSGDSLGGSISGSLGG